MGKNKNDGQATGPDVPDALAVQAQMDALTQELHDVRNAGAELQSTIERLTADNAAHEQNIALANGEAAELRENLAAAKATISELRQENQSLADSLEESEELETLRAENANLTDQLARIDTARHKGPVHLVLAEPAIARGVEQKPTFVLLGGKPAPGVTTADIDKALQRGVVRARDV